MRRFITVEKLIKIARKYLRLIFEFEQRFSDLLGGEMDNVHWRGLLPRGGGGGRGLNPLQLLHGERHRGRGGGGGRVVLLVGRQLTGGNIGPAAQHQPRVYGGGRAGVEDIIENTKVTQLHQVLGFQIDHWFVLTVGLTPHYICWISDVVDWSARRPGERGARYIYIFSL